MKYYNVTSTKNGDPWCFKGVGVSEQSLEGLRRVFAQDGVELDATYAYTWADRPLYRRDEETGVAGLFGPAGALPSADSLTGTYRKPFGCHTRS